MAGESGQHLVGDIHAKEWEEHRRDWAAVTRVTPVFRGWMPDGYETEESPRVLLVGKATSGAFDQPDDHQDSFNGKYAFWAFARRIARALDQPVNPLACVAWTNIAKFNTTGIEPTPEVLRDAKELVVQTLFAEIRKAQPDVVVFTVSHFCDEVVQRVAKAPSDTYWDFDGLNSVESIHDIWWRTSDTGISYVWMCHPQGASEEHLNFASNKIASLAKR
ncbi:MAG: hypothetical protein V4734_03660 [Terriglobus sp.]